MSAARNALVPLYLMACLLLGGSAQGVWQNALLQLAGVLIIAWSAAAPGQPIARGAKSILVLAAAGIVIVALQQIPLPASIWAHGARTRIAAGYAVLGQPIPPLPIWLTPYESLGALLGIIPPLAIFCGIVRLRAFDAAWLAIVLVLGSFAGIVLGVLQVGTGPRSPFYLYPETNFGSGVGFFANANHMGSLLVITLPFVAALAASARGRDKQRASAMLVVGIVLALVLIVGIALNGSLAGYALAVPTTAASVLILLPSRSRWRSVLAAIAALSAIAAIVGMASSGIGSGRVGQKATTSVQSRQTILKTTAKAIEDYMPFGSGLGSFRRVYRLYEAPDSVTGEYVIHAHNDYAELALELGIPGIAIIVIFLLWWGRATWSVWLKGEGGPFSRAASVASAAVLIHSTVDFPLRTAAIGGCFAMCIALLADRRQQPRQEADDLRPTRHLVFE